MASADNVVNSQWRRKVPKGDAWDEVVLTGFIRIDFETVEVVLRSASEFGENVSASPESFQEFYERASADDSAHIHALRDRLHAVEAATPWITGGSEINARN
jgi:hypothetical protein